MSVAWLLAAWLAVPCAGLSDEDQAWMGRVDYSLVNAATQRLKAHLGGRVNFRPEDSLKPEDWAEVLAGLGPDEVRLMQRRYPKQATAISDAAPKGAAEPPPAAPSDAPAGSAPGRRERPAPPGGATPRGQSPGSSADGPGAGGEAPDEEESSKDEGGVAVDSQSGDPSVGPKKSRQLGAGEAADAAAKAQGLVGGREALWGKDREAEDLPGGAGAAQRGVPPGRPDATSAAPSEAAAAPTRSAAAVGEAMDEGDPRARALAAIARYRSDGTVGGAKFARTVPTPPSSAAPGGARRSTVFREPGAWTPPSSGGGGVAPGPESSESAPRAGASPKAEKKAAKETPYGELTEEEEAELDSFLKMIDEVAASGVLDSEAANGSLTAAEAKAAADGALEKALADVRAILGKSGRTLTMDEQAQVLAAAKRLGFRFNAKQAWNLLRALEKGKPPPPRVDRSRTFWERLIRWFKRLFVSFFG